MKLFIWDKFDPDYYDGLAFAIAETEEQAEKLVIKAYGRVHNWGNLSVHEVNEPIARALGGTS